MNSKGNMLGPNITCPQAFSAKELPVCDFWRAGQVRGGDPGETPVLRGTQGDTKAFGSVEEPLPLFWHLKDDYVHEEVGRSCRRGTGGGVTPSQEKE